MKIDNTNKPAAPPAAVARAQQPKPAAEQAQAAATRPETVAVQLSATAAQLKPEPQTPIDKARVQEIKQAIAEGRFKINTDAIADRIIASARELVDRQKQQA